MKMIKFNFTYHSFLIIGLSLQFNKPWKSGFWGS